MLLRRRYLVAGSIIVAAGIVTVVAYLSPKQWQSTTTIRLEPLVVPGLHSTDGSDLSPASAMALELAAARGDEFRDGVAQEFGEPPDFEVNGDADSATMAFTVTADSANRAWYDAVSVANGWMAWGRRQGANTRAAELQGQIDQRSGDPTAGAEVADLQAQLASVEAVLALPAGGVLSEVPSPPDDPVSPNLVARIVVAAALGLLVGLLLAWVVERRTSRAAPERVPTPDRRRPPVQRAGRAVLGGLVVALPMLLVAAAIAGVVSVWELRPTTAEREEIDFGCLERWTDGIEDGTAVSVSEDSNAFFRDNLHEFTFPRLAEPDAEDAPRVVLHVIPGDGPQACGGYHLEIERT